jgi:hypothetical protein
VKTLLKTLAAVAFASLLVFLYTWIVGQKGTLLEPGNNRSKILYSAGALGLAYFLYRVVFEPLWNKKKKK